MTDDESLLSASSLVSSSSPSLKLEATEPNALKEGEEVSSEGNLNLPKIDVSRPNDTDTVSIELLVILKQCQEDEKVLPSVSSSTSQQVTEPNALKEEEEVSSAGNIPKVELSRSNDTDSTTSSKVISDKRCQRRSKSYRQSRQSNRYTDGICRTIIQQ